MHFIFFTLGLKVEIEKEEDVFYLYPPRIQDLYTVNIKYVMDVSEEVYRSSTLEEVYRSEDSVLPG